MINIKTTLNYLINYDGPAVKAIESMDVIGKNRFDIIKFEVFVKNEIDIVAKQKAGSSECKQILESIRKSYNIHNLKKHQLIMVDESDNTFTFNKSLEHLLRQISEKMKIKPITDKRFKAHSKTLIDIVEETKVFCTKPDSEQEVFIEYLQEFLRDVKQDFETNKTSIITRVENLSRLLNKKEAEGAIQRALMSEIDELCDKYIEPFLHFISGTRDPNGFIPNMIKVRLFFKNQEMLIEESDINKFILNFSSYVKDMKDVYVKINDYRRKGQQELIVFNAFEKAFNHLEECVMSLQDGKLTRNHLESHSEFMEKYPLFGDLKVNNEKPALISVDYQKIAYSFESIEKTLLIDSEADDVKEPIKEIDAESLLKIQNSEKVIRERARLNTQTTLTISRILNKHSEELNSPDEEVDLQSKIDTLLRKYINNYNPFQSMYAYSYLRKRIKNVKIGFNTRKSLYNLEETERLVYRPVYVQGI